MVNDIRLELRRGAISVNVLADERVREMCRLATRDPQVIMVGALSPAVEPLDVRADTESTLARVVRVFGDARPHRAYLVANGRAD